MAAECGALIKDVKRRVENCGGKRMADEFDKRLSSLYGELAERDWAKLGLADFLDMAEHVLADDAPPEAQVMAKEILDKINKR